MRKQRNLMASSKTNKVICPRCTGNGYNYSKGDTPNLKEEIAGKLVKFNYAKEIKEANAGVTEPPEGQEDGENTDNSKEKQPAKTNKKGSKKSGDK